MTGKPDFTAAEWDSIVHGPPTAGLIVITAQRGGIFRETLALTQAYVEARRQHGQSELLDEIVAARPALDHTRYHSPDELKAAGLQHLSEALCSARVEGDAGRGRRLQEVRPRAGQASRRGTPGARDGRERRRAGRARRDQRHARQAGRLTGEMPLHPQGPDRASEDEFLDIRPQFARDGELDTDPALPAVCRRNGRRTPPIRSSTTSCCSTATRG